MNGNNKNQQTVHIDGRAAIAVLVTFVLLLICLSVMFVGLAMDASDGGSIPVDGIGGGGGGGSGSPSKPVGGSAVGTKTGMVLPSATQSGTYLSSGNGVEISSVKSMHAALINVDTNTLVAGKGADTVIHPASMTKVMTLLVACENAKDPTVLLTVTEEMLDRRTELDGSGELVNNATVVDADGNTQTIDIVGKSVTLEDALHLINYQSDTVACLLVAEHIAGSEAAFVELMNKKAQDIGLTNTKFVNSTGLTEKDKTHNTTTCREMAAIMACAMKNKVVGDIITAYGKYDKYKTDIYENGESINLYIPFYADWYTRGTRLNNNPWAGTVKIIGGKTGYEDISESCFVTYGVNDDTNTSYICVTVGKSIDAQKQEVNNAASTADTRAIYRNYAKE